MRILVVGAGLTGCSIARLLHDKGFSVKIIEKEDRVGGLCTTEVHECGLKYEPYGARTFHTNIERVKKFIRKYDEFNGYIHRKGMILNDQFFPFPMTIKMISKLPEEKQIFQEIRNTPQCIDTTNFETAAISIFGRTLYNYFIKNYSEKMWGRRPEKLTAEWAPKRLEMRRNGDDRLFKNQWQGLPRRGYSVLLENMIAGIDIELNQSEFDAAHYDLVFATAPIDQIMKYKYGRLEYRSLSFEYHINEKWEDNRCGTINLPQHSDFIRKCNFKILHKQESKRSLIQYQKPVSAGDIYLPMYPVNTIENNMLFDRFLREICTTNIVPAGRLGLFKYIDMDKAVNMAFEISSLVDSYTNLNFEERYLKIKTLI